MGYRHMLPSSLWLCWREPYMECPYRFNSFLQRDLSVNATGALVDAWLDRLSRILNITIRLSLRLSIRARTLCLRIHSRTIWGPAGAAEQFLFLSFEGPYNQNSMTDQWDIGARGTTGNFKEESRAFDDVRRIRKPLMKIRMLIGLSARHFQFSIAARQQVVAESFSDPLWRKAPCRETGTPRFVFSVETVLSDLSRDMQHVLAGDMDAASFWIPMDICGKNLRHPLSFYADEKTCLSVLR